MAIRCVGVAIKAGEPRALAAVRDLAKWLAERDVRACFEPDAAAAVGEIGVSRDEMVRHADLLVVLGGDGTLLAVARAVEERAVPILGINLGSLGFLVEVSVDEMTAALARALAGEMTIEPRMRLAVRLLREGRELRSWLALNDAVITKGASARIVDLEAHADGQLVTTYHADGLIVSTPTGSTAYNLSAGGPIVQPSVDALVLTPIAPHTLTNRPIVIPTTSPVRVQPNMEDRDEVFVTFDGQAGFQLESGDDITVACADTPLWLIKPTTRSYFEVLRTKLKWGER